MRHTPLHTARLTTLSPISKRRATPSAAEWALCAACALALLLAVVLPATGLPAGYHDFADQRSALGLPHAMDVLSNLPFALAGVWLLVLRRRWQRQLNRREMHALGSMHALSLSNERESAHTALFQVGVIGLGLLATALCSGVYHWHPMDASLCIDRLGMSVAFAGVLSLAVSDRIGARAGMHLVWPLLLAAVGAALWAWRMGNMTPWAVVQGFGLLLLLAMSWRQPQPGALGVHWVWVVVAYGLAKALEVGDAQLFALSHGWVSGHSLKHVAAALAVLPIGLALRRHLCAD